ncbi:acyl-CoA N-acyltransferase [Serendipita vermifera]|nr:acyl-CoA N-acyltransferase [Serendipita vermifera]
MGVENFCFPLRDLMNNRVNLVRFDPSVHSAPFIALALEHPSIWSHIPIGPFTSTQAFNELISNHITPDPSSVLFAIFDRTKCTAKEENGNDMVGIIALISASKDHLKAEISYVIVFPPFQRTGVASNAVGLLLHFLLDLPSTMTEHDSDYDDNLPHENDCHTKYTVSGLGLRRVQWQASTTNVPSLKTAKQMGFVLEGTLRWDRVMPLKGSEEKKGNGKIVRNRDPRARCSGRDSLILSLCWDDWEFGGREAVDKLMSKTIS